VDLLRGWQVAVQALGTGGPPYVEWEDRDDAARPSLEEIGVRYCLVARADVDSDGDGVPDARERFVLGTDPHEPDGEDGTGDGDDPAGEPPEHEPPGCIWYVDAARGEDALSGLKPLAEGTDGPKRTVAGALGVAEAGDTVIVAGGRQFWGNTGDVPHRQVFVDPFRFTLVLLDTR
jgi:hypothetical protein